MLKELVKQLPITLSVKKHVAAVHMSGELSLLERKLVNIMLLNAYDNLLTQTIHTMPVAILLEMLGWSPDGGVEDLKVALENILRTVLSYDVLNKNGTKRKRAWVASTLLAGAKIEDGVFSYTYSQFLAEEMAHPEMYATLNLGVQNEFRSGYALNLYENCLRFKNVGSTGWIEIGLWRQLLGAESTHYDNFKNLSRDVIKRSVIEVNKVSDIEISPEYQREIRKVKNIRFSVKENPKPNAVEQITVIDNNAEIRQSPAFKRLIDHGIGEKLALVWLLRDPVRVEQAVEHVESLDKVKSVKNPAGYIRTLVESDSAIGNSPAKVREAAKVALVEQETSQAEAVQQDRTAVVKTAVQGLSDDARRRYAADYVASAGVGHVNSYDAVTGKFKNAIERIQFTAWLHATVAQHVTPQ